MPVQIEQIIDGGMSFQESLCLLDGFEKPHASFSNTGGLV